MVRPIQLTLYTVHALFINKRVLSSTTMLKTGAIYTLVDAPAPTQSSSSQEKKQLTVSHYLINVQSLQTYGIGCTE